MNNNNDCESNQQDRSAQGQLRADFLRRLSGSNKFDSYRRSEEKKRQELIKDIREGKLVKQHSK